jgi:transposase
LLTRAEKEKQVIELYEGGKNYRDIAKEVRISLKDISSIIRKHTGKQGRAEQHQQQERQQEETIDTKVFKLFDEGETPVKVAISLNLPAGEVTRLQTEYRKLMGLQELNQLQEEIGNDIFELRQTYQFAKERGYTPRQLIDAAAHLDELALLRSENKRLVQENQNLEEQTQNKTIELDESNGNLAIVQQDLNSINAGIQKNKEELERLNNKKLQVQTVIANLNTSAGYQQTTRIAEAAASGILMQNKAVLLAACRALFQALKYEPRNELQILIYGSLSYPNYEPGNASMPQNYTQMRQAILLQAAEEIYKDLLAKAVNSTMSTAFSTWSSPGYQLNWTDTRSRQ